jgi:hypothetical protein
VKSIPKGLTLEELKDVTVGVAGHVPEFDDERGLWYCDIDIAHGSSYFPFVRLALARFQPTSLPNAHLSRVVLTDFMQLVANRSATITFPAANQTLVQVSGPVGVGRLSRDTMIKDTAPIPHLDRSRVVRVTVQSRDPKVKSTTDPLGWLKVSETLLGLKSKSGPTVTWQGTVPLPAGVRGKKTHRLLITEHEVFLTDPDTKERVIGSKIAAIDAEKPVRERIVYADEVIL